MKKTYKLLFLLLLFVLSIAITGCKGATTTAPTTTAPTTTAPGTTAVTTTQQTDTVAPVIVIGQPTITHQVDAVVNLLADVSATDNVSAAGDIDIVISNYNGYDKSVVGTYVITVTATDEASNFSTATITVIVKLDMLAPTLTGSVSTINHIAGEEVSLTGGLSGVDNIDGINVIFTVSNLGTYDNTVPGTYVIQITMSDVAGNVSNPFNRTVIVSESFTRAEMISFDDEIIRYQAIYNPQVLNGNTGTGFNSAYDGHYVNVLSKDYVEWMLEYAPERLGSGVGWSIIAVTDADDKIVYVRHWNSGEAYLNESDELVSISSVNWSTGTIRTWTEMEGETLVGKSNAKYSSGEMGLMMANLNEWIPEDGKVFIFLNWTTIGLNQTEQVVAIANSSDMSRSMGANYIMNSDENGDDIRDYALGRELKLIDPELSNQTVRETFDSVNPFPVITIPSQKYINSTGVWKNQYTETVYLSELSEIFAYNPLEGIFANDGKGNDVIDDVTYKVYRYTTGEIAYGLQTSIGITDPLWAEYFEEVWTLAANEVTLENALVPGNDGVNFVIEYKVTANGHTDTAYKLILVKQYAPDYIELYGESDSVYSKVMGLEQRMEMNPDFTEFGPLTATTKGMIFEGTTFKELTSLPTMAKGVAVVLDSYYRVNLIRFANGAIFEMDGVGNITSTGLSWTAGDLLSGLQALVSDTGYVLIYPEGLSGSVLAKALKAYYDFDFAGGEIATIAQTNTAVQVNLVIKEVQEVSTLLVDDVAPIITINSVDMTVAVVQNSKDALVFNSMLGGAGFRTDSGKAYYYSKEMYASLSLAADVVSSFTTLSANHGVPWFRDGVIMVFDADGNFVLARVMTTAAAAEVYADGTVIYANAAVIATTEAAKLAAGEANMTWDLVIPNAANTVAHGPLADILSVVPENGSFIIFPGSVTSDVRNLGVRLVWNQDYPGFGIIVDATLPEQPAGNPDPATNGFDFDAYTATYLGVLNIKVDFVSTVIEKAAKLTRPVVSIDGNIATWAPIIGAASYDMYVDGVLALEDVGELALDELSYTFNLGLLNLPVGDYEIQLRAITANAATKSTSVLSDALSYTCERLDSPLNFILTDNVVSWDVVVGASNYLVSIDDGEFFTVETNQTTIPDEKLVAGTSIKVIASGSETTLDSIFSEYLLDIEVILKEVILGQYTLPIVEFTVSSWMRYADPLGGNDVGGQFIEGIIVITNAFDFTLLDDTAKVFSGGYAAVYDSEMNVKYIVDRWGHEWNPVDGWTTNAGAWTYGANLFVSYFRSHLAAGDIMIIASQYGLGLDEGTYRNHFGNALIKDLGVLTTDHRAVDLLTAIDPSTVTVLIQEKVMTQTISLGTNDLPLFSFDLATWLNYADPLGGNDVGGQFVPGIIMITDAFGISALDDATLIFAGGYAAVMDSDMHVKYIVDRWGHEWNPTDGWTTNAGGWPYGASLYASYFKPHLAEGDMIILASQFNGGLSVGTYRNYFGNALIKNLGTVTTDHRAVDLLTALDPATVTITFGEATKVLRMGQSVLDVKEFDLATWMNYIDPLGGNDIGAQFIPSLIVITDAFGVASLDDAITVFSGGYIVVVDSDMHIKYFVDRWAHEWNPTDGWTSNAGGWPWALNLKASYFKPFLAEGDMMILASQYGTGLSAGTYRNLMGNALIKDLGTVTTDHRAVLLTEAYDLSTITITIATLE